MENIPPLRAHNIKKGDLKEGKIAKINERLSSTRAQAFERKKRTEPATFKKSNPSPSKNELEVSENLEKLENKGGKN